jgi:hypothetical protein
MKKLVRKITKELITPDISKGIFIEPMVNVFWFSRNFIRDSSSFIYSF